MHSLVKLSLGGCSISDHGLMILLAEGLGTQKYLRELDLSDNLFGKEASSALLLALTGLPSLEVLALGGGLDPSAWNGWPQAPKTNEDGSSRSFLPKLEKLDLCGLHDDIRLLQLLEPFPQKLQVVRFGGVKLLKALRTKLSLGRSSKGGVMVNFVLGAHARSAGAHALRSEARTDTLGLVSSAGAGKCRWLRGFRWELEEEDLDRQLGASFTTMLTTVVAGSVDSTAGMEELSIKLSDNFQFLGKTAFPPIARASDLEAARQFCDAVARADDTYNQFPISASFNAPMKCLQPKANLSSFRSKFYPKSNQDVIIFPMPEMLSKEGHRCNGLDNGQMLQVTVPAPPAQTAEVTLQVPFGVGPGQMIQATAHGVNFTAQAPFGAAPGTNFTARVPLPAYSGQKTILVHYQAPVAAAHKLDRPRVADRVKFALALSDFVAGRRTDRGFRGFAVFVAGRGTDVVTTLNLCPGKQNPDVGMGPIMAVFFRFGLEDQGCRLTKLNVSGNQFGDDGAVALGIALRKNRTLTSLRFDQNNTGIAGFKAFRGALYGNKKLHDCSMPDDDIRAALEGLGSNYQVSR
jgi:hypothetical protein